MTKKRTSSKILENPYPPTLIQNQAGRDKTNKGGAPMLYAGIDAHKHTCTIVIIDDQGEKVKEGKVRTDEIEIKRFFEFQAQNIEAVVETGLNCYFMYRILKGYVKEVCIAHSYKLRIIAEAKVKTDHISALTLAQMLRIGYIPQIYVPSEKTLKLRELMRARVYLVSQKTRFKNKIHSILDKNGIKPPSGTDLFGKAGRTYLNSLNTGLNISNPEGGIIGKYLKLIEKLEENIKAIEIVLGNNLDSDLQVKLLRSIPGIGKIASHLLLAEIGDISRFRTKEKLCSFVGLCPRIYCSGTTERYGHISKEGNKYIRWILTECAQVATRHSPGLRRMFLRIKKNRGGKVAIIAVARRMLELVFVVLTKKEAFKEAKAFKNSRHACFLSTS